MGNSKQEIIFTETDDKIIDFFCTGLKEGKNKFYTFRNSTKNICIRRS